MYFSDFFLFFVIVLGYLNIVFVLIKGIYNILKMNYGRWLILENFFSKCCSVMIYELELNMEEVSSDIGVNVIGLILGLIIFCFFLMYI